MKKYIAKKDTWFKEDTECELLGGDDYGGLFAGTHIITDITDASNRKRNIGDEVLDEEYCFWEEFDIIEVQ